MTPEKQRIAIAEKLGLMNIRLIDGISLVYGPEWPDCRLVPDYPNDLNAMHEAERCLSENQYDEYRKWLTMINADDYKPGYHRNAISATADQRAEAFLKTLGLWEET